MAGETVLLQDATVARLDRDGLVEALQREALGVVVAVDVLGRPLADEVARQVAINAARRRVETLTSATSRTANS